MSVVAFSAIAAGLLAVIAAVIAVMRRGPRVRTIAAGETGTDTRTHRVLHERPAQSFPPAGHCHDAEPEQGGPEARQDNGGDGLDLPPAGNSEEQLLAGREDASRSAVPPAEEELPPPGTHELVDSPHETAAIPPGLAAKCGGEPQAGHHEPEDAEAAGGIDDADLAGAEAETAAAGTLPSGSVPTDVPVYPEEPSRDTACPPAAAGNSENTERKVAAVHRESEPAADGWPERQASADSGPPVPGGKLHEPAGTRADAGTIESSARPRRQAVHRDRRGRRRQLRSRGPEPMAPQPGPALAARAPAEAALRLALHPVQRSIRLSLILSRPEGFPERVHVWLGGPVEAGFYDAARYDDIDVPWTPELLSGELRYESSEGFQWLRSARRVHIFSADPAEPGLVSVSAVRSGTEHAVICRLEDVPLVEDIARSAGSPALGRHDRWRGVPEGWCVLSGYIPVHTAGTIADAALRPLDPGFDIDVRLAGGLEVRSKVFAEGHPPRIEIPALPDGVSVSIGGEHASISASGGWEAPGWDDCGQHTIDIVPGPSLTYEIIADPVHGGGWAFWDAHEERFPGHEPWARARICGAAVGGPSGEKALAHESRPTLIALGARRQAIALSQRSDAGASIALLPEPPEFLIEAWGPRRNQGRVIWLGLSSKAPAAREKQADLAWAAAVRSAAARRLPVEGADAGGARRAWQRAVRRARSIRRQRR